MDEHKFLPAPVIEQVGSEWGVWIDDADELLVCSSYRHAEQVAAVLAAYRNGAASWSRD